MHEVEAARRSRDGDVERGLRASAGGDRTRLDHDHLVEAIEKLAGAPRDLQAMGKALEAQIAGDRFGPVEPCLE